MSGPKKKDHSYLKKLYEQLGSVEAVASHVGFHPVYVGKRLRQQGIYQGQGRICDQRFDIELICKMNKEGQSCLDIASQMGCSRESVRRVLLTFDISRNQRGAHGVKNPIWRGGRLVDKHGYVLLRQKDHPFANSSGYVREHRLVMETKIGRYLHPKEVVHHLNGITHDNRIGNLQLFESNGKHLSVDLKGKCPKWTPEGLQKIRQGYRRRKEALRLRNPPRGPSGCFVQKNDGHQPPSS